VERPRTNRWLAEASGRAATYDDHWVELASRGENVHGEADFVFSLQPGSVLDAGCGTGRVAIELARRGVDVVGVDLDPAMLVRARGKAAGLTWVEGDLAEVDLGRRFDVVVLAGNVMIFLEPGTERAVVANLARHLEPGGALIAGFELQPGRYDLRSHDAAAAAAGLSLAERWATWDREPYDPGKGSYAVSVHRPACVARTQDLTTG
jgi:SAM-dependent methyltransferase